ncbi:N-6 DNA methylase [Mesorhizobium sp. M1A.T.Ca.IN.004.03.1.1]|uniref:N-6 DNA methylase n=1 Tax=Mesorhizobium sp. M1A.T.Ca.IN.004.03.1.1 TaxID=2496795 RepID=UPI0013E3589B|nr:N-6 DNA methylase [Mesorhizobium sp. M1A.T.Ca.IN.004.03.1.1]
MIDRRRTTDILTNLAARPGHDEVKAGFRELLIEEFGIDRADLEFERRVPEVKGRLDALIGRTIFEAKSNIDKEWGDVVRRMPDYLADREHEEQEQFVGIASDGLKWVIFERKGNDLVKVKETSLNPAKPEMFLAWLDGAVALKSSLAPEPLVIRAELGQESVAFRRAMAALTQLWEKLKDDSAVALKRQLWASLLKLVYGKEVEHEDLWFQHTYLVIVAKAIGTAVLDVREDDPKRMLAGAAIQSANIFGAVESDFFDWAVADVEGENLVRRIMAHVRRFRLREVKSDVLKVLYESLIDRSERHGLGEYYTPDWLATKVVRNAVDQPLHQHVLDPACGSGTFLFHAIRNFLREAEDAGLDPKLTASEVTAHVMGMDIHPVAVIIARITYILALVPALAQRVGSVSIPVYLGDAMQLSIHQMLGGKELTIHVPPPPPGQSQSGQSDGKGGEKLDFPETFCRDPSLFDKAIERMRSGSLEELTRKQIEAALVRITEQHYKRELTKEETGAIQDLGHTYTVFDRLRREGRDSVWAYVARNLSRPLALSAAGGWAHVIVGNPPWVAFRHMNADLQKRFKELANAERVLVKRVPSQNDLCALFTVRSASLYLKAAGKIAFVLPMAALTRGQFENFRLGSFTSTCLAFDEAWTMDESVQPLFPVPSCVVYARKRATAKKMPNYVRAYTGKLPYRDAPEEVADANLTVSENAPGLRTAQHSGGSPYRARFRNGATLFPRMLIFVERKAAGMLGGDSTMPILQSRRSAQEKDPWKSLPGIEGAVETEFVRPILLGESITPYRVFRPFEGVVGADRNGKVLDAEAAANLGFAGLHRWLAEAETAWMKNRSSDKMTFKELNDYFGQLSGQFPIAPLRVVYSKAGTVPAAAVVRDSISIIENTLYWTGAASESEATYLTAILNSEAARKRGEDLQAKGQWGARHFDKVIFALPIPLFDPKSPLHQQIAEAGRLAELHAAEVQLPGDVKFQQARKLVRGRLATAGISQRIDQLVERLISL